MKCPKCHFENPEETNYCGKCGTPLPQPAPRNEGEGIRGAVPDSSEIGGHEPSSPEFGIVSHDPKTETLQTPIRELTTGSMFAGRYQIIEELGRGGMGRVYRALDKKLNEEVALKLVRPEIAADRETLERFHNELKLARKISHPHVGRMYELMEEKGSHFITMEYVPGQDLRGLIRQTGKLAAETAVSIAKQTCEGLTEAHKQGVIHRDLKPSNIIIDRAGSARIMDFGIARSLSGKGITGAGVMIGTPEYMSPEQVEGKDVDQRSDIYSLGIILYEMLTGRVPFEGDTPFTVGVKQKSATPKNPKLLNPNIPEGLSGIILKCLEKDKSNRYQSAVDVGGELERVEKGLPTAERTAAERATPTHKPFSSKEITVKFQPKKLIIPALAAIALIVIAAVIFWPKKASDLDPNLVAVAVFENKTGDPKLDPIGSLAAERIMQGLTQVGGFSVAPMPPAETLAAASKGKDRLRALAEATRASKIVHGDYYIQGENIQFHAWVEDMAAKRAAKRNLLTLEPASGPAADPAAALEPLRLRLMGGLAGVFNPEVKEFLSFLKEPPNFEAAREYIEGLRAFNRMEWSQSREHFFRAAERDPKLRIALLYAAFAHGFQNELAKADEIAQKVEDARADLSSVERIMLDWLRAYLRGDDETQLRLSRQLVSYNKTQAWIFLNAQDAMWNNYLAEAVSVLSWYDPYTPARKDFSPRYWYIMTSVHHMLGNYQQELKEARRGRKQFPEILTMLMYEARPLAALGRTKELQKLFEDSETLPPQGGISAGIIMLDAGEELRAHGFREESIRVLNQTLQWYKARPNEEKASARNRYARARIFYTLEKWDEAKTMFDGLRTDSPESYSFLGYSGVVAAHLGDGEEALRISKELEDIKRPYLRGWPTYWRARIAAVLGDKEGAVNLLRLALKQGYSYDFLHPCQDFESLADYPPYIQLMKPKG